MGRGGGGAVWLKDARRGQGHHLPDDVEYNRCGTQRSRLVQAEQRILVLDTRLQRKACVMCEDRTKAGGS